MRNRITWKGFGAWLNKQKNDKKFFCGDAGRCPVAGYVLSVFNAKSAWVGDYDEIGYSNGRDEDVDVTAPKIFGKFISEFDLANVNNALSAKKVFNMVSKEEGIV